MNPVPCDAVCELNARNQEQNKQRLMPLKHLKRTGFFLVTALLLQGLVTSAQAKTPKKLLVVTVTKGFRHSSIPTAEKTLQGLATKTGDFTVDYVRDDKDMAEKMTMASLARYDGVIFANTTGELPLPDKAGFLKWLESGKAFVGMHSASDTFRGHTPLDPYNVMLGGEFLTHGAQASVECLNQDPNHPACKHFGAAYKVHDEIYIQNGFKRSMVHGLLTLDKHPNTGMPGDYPIAWVKKVGKGRVFYTALGHREDVWESDPYQKHITGGIRWALGLEKGEATPQSTTVKLSRDEVRAGFRPLYNGDNLNGWHARNASVPQSWSSQNGMLVNQLAKAHGTDLITDEKFKNFTIRYEYMVPKGANSGLYLRGRHELQIMDDYDSKTPKEGGNGGLYSTKAPDKFVSRKAGEWQQAEATMQGNRLTVVLNGVKIHDNVEVSKATGGELDKNLNEPGPLMLQGDHGAVAFRNVRIKLLK